MVRRTAWDLPSTERTEVRFLYDDDNLYVGVICFDSEPDKLVIMANQIARFFAAQGEARALPQIADHIEKFWDPRMRREISAHLASSGAGLDPLARSAIESLKPTGV